MERKKYNLHSSKSDGVQTHIQLQSSEKNSEFLRNLLEVKLFWSDLNSSSSDVECSGPLDTDSDNVSTQPCLFDRLVVNSPSTSASNITTSDTQALINLTILQQLTAIG